MPRHRRFGTAPASDSSAVPKSRLLLRPQRAPSATLNPLHQQESTWRRQARILVNVHPGDPPITPVSVATHSLTELPRMNNLHGNDS